MTAPDVGPVTPVEIPDGGFAVPGPPPEQSPTVVVVDVAAPEPVVESEGPAPVVEAPRAPSVAEILEKAGVGSEFVKVAHGWKVKYVVGGTVLLHDVPSLTEIV